MDAKLTPLLDVSGGVFCHLLEIGNSKLVIDCGIGPQLDTSCYSSSVIEAIKKADAILVTSFETAHFGAVGLFPDIPVVCSQPTAVLRSIFCDPSSPLLPNIKTLKFSQPYQIKDLTICVYNAGYTLGNSIFKIAYGVESIVIGYNICHRREEYFDGATLGALKDAHLLITNSVYGRVRPYKISERNKALLDIVYNCSGRVVIRVSFARLFEVLSTLSGESVAVVSNKAKEFISRVSSMVEWAGPYALDLVGSMSITYSHPEDALKYRLIVLPEDEGAYKYTGTILERLNENDVFVTVDHSVDVDEYKSMKVYNFQYETVKKKKADKTDSIQKSQTEDNDKENEEVHWTKYKSTIFVNGYNRSELFQYLKKRKHNNDYGEVFKPVIVNQNKSVKEEEVNEEFVEIEHTKIIRQGVDPIFKTAAVDFYGKSDFDSFKTIISSGNISNLVLLPDAPHLATFLCASLKLNHKPNVKICTQEAAASISLPRPPQIVPLPHEILDLRFTKIGGASILKAQVALEDEGLVYKGKGTPLFFGHIDKNKIRSAILQNNMRVKIVGDSLDVNNKVHVTFKNNTITISSDDETALISVRNIIYSFIVKV